ncbi:hypothetical protein MRX96_018704 [Rhipicephalus microplus]
METPSLHKSPRNCSRCRSCSRSRRRSLPRKKSRSNLRGVPESSEFGVPGAMPAAGNTWADKAKGTVRVAGSTAAPAVTDSYDARIDQLPREVNSLRKANGELTKQPSSPPSLESVYFGGVPPGSPPSLQSVFFYGIPPSSPPRLDTVFFGGNKVIAPVVDGVEHLDSEARYSVVLKAMGILTKL